MPLWRNSSSVWRLGFCLSLVLSGCASLPEAGPSTAEVLTSGHTDASGSDYVFVDLKMDVADKLRQQAGEGLAASFGDRRVSAESVIGVGDAVEIVIWEAGAGGLFSAEALPDKSSPGANSARIPEQIVARDGAVTVPYAGRIRVAGLTARAVQTEIESALAGKAIQPQVLVTVPRAESAMVSIGGEVANGARIPISVRGSRLLDVIAAAGGVRAPVNETYVELSRGDRTVRAPLSRIVRNPRENVYLRPNDVVTLVRDPQAFIAYGATGRNALIPFDADGVTLAEAVAKAGGILDERADPQGLFVFRFEQRAVALALRPDLYLPDGARSVPVVYRLDLRDARSLFVEQTFTMKNRDLLYVSNAPITDIQKVMAVLNGGLGTASELVTMSNAASTIK